MITYCSMCGKENHDGSEVCTASKLDLGYGNKMMCGGRWFSKEPVFPKYITDKHDYIMIVKTEDAYRTDEYHKMEYLICPVIYSEDNKYDILDHINPSPVQYKLYRKDVFERLKQAHGDFYDEDTGRKFWKKRGKGISNIIKI